MKYRIPVTALALALGLACTAAFAAEPVSASAALPSYTPASQASQDGYSGPIVSVARKVYFFNALDRNHNGMLSRSEIPTDMVALRRDFTRADFDGNGQLSRSEIYLFERGLAPQYVGVNHADVFVFQAGNSAEGLSMAQ